MCIHFIYIVIYITYFYKKLQFVYVIVKQKNC